CVLGSENAPTAIEIFSFQVPLGIQDTTGERRVVIGGPILPVSFGIEEESSVIVFSIDPAFRRPGTHTGNVYAISCMDKSFRTEMISEICSSETCFQWPIRVF